LAWNTILDARLYNRVSAAIIESANEYTTASLVELNISSESELKNIEVTLKTTSELTPAEAVALQADISEQLQSPVSLTLVTIPMQILEP
jgi:hypothetical protein